MAQKHSGSCLCEEIRFEIDGSFESFYLCHCQHCQKDTGSAHAANLFSQTAKLLWLTETQNIQTFTLPNTRHTRSFCRTCGSPVPSLQMGGQLLVVPAGSLTSRFEMTPTAHLFGSSKALWDEDLHKIPMFERYPI